jgi:hypothetical protein
MSFARFTSSDVYIFEHSGGFIQCCGCSLVEPEDGEMFGSANLNTPREAIKHLKKHKKAGENVGGAIKRIKETYEDLDAPIEPYVESPEVLDRIRKRFRELYETNVLGLGSDTYSAETITIHISKRLINGEPSHWSVEVSDTQGMYMGEATAPTFNRVFDSAYELITGDDGEFDSVHNEWVDFDANRKDA